MTGAELGFLIILAGALFVYVLPTFIAFARRHPNRWVILLINAVFGATGLGWFGSLIWAMSAVHRSPTGNHGGESGLNVFVNDPQLVRVEPQTRSRAPASAPVDPVERLAQLKRLLDAGAISAEEHASLRKSVLETLVG